MQSLLQNLLFFRESCTTSYQVTRTCLVEVVCFLPCATFYLCGNQVESTHVYSMIVILQVNLFGTGSTPLYLCSSTITLLLLLETRSIEIDLNNVNWWLLQCGLVFKKSKKIFKLNNQSQIREFVDLKDFSVKIHNPKDVIVKEVFLHLPIL